MASRARDISRRERFDRRRVVLFTPSVDRALVEEAGREPGLRKSVNDVVRSAVDAYLKRTRRPR